MEFREDINGLRAFAILSVVLFHFGVGGVSGGFVGVDIFFVISGFLMTGIIFRRLNRGEFSLSGFYLDRARRIFPALAFLCICIAAIGWFALPPTEYKLIGKHVAASIVFISNIIFAREDGYFDQASHSKWLLHTWSLSVEWQFYLLYPLLILLLKRLLPSRAIAISLAVLALFSFSLSVMSSELWPSFAFYMLPTRAWELLAGGLVYLYPIRFNERLKFAATLAGIALMTLSVVYIKDGDVWPGWLALFPVMGACLIISARNENIFLVTSPPAQFLGAISYSVYLWHWPIVVASNYFGCGNLWQIKLLGVIGSLMAGWLSCRYVERSVGKRSYVFRDYPPIAELLGTVGIIFLSASVIFLGNGLPLRMTEIFRRETRDLVMPMVDNGWCFYSVDTIKGLPVGAQGVGCYVGDPTAVSSGILFGDSYAGQYDPFWSEIGRALHVKINSVSTNWCYPSGPEGGFTGPVDGRSYKQCLVDRRYVKQKLPNVDFAILAGQWGNIYGQGKLSDVFSQMRFAATHTRLVVIMAAPTTFDVDITSRYETSLILGRKFDITDYPRSSDANTRAANELLKVYAARFQNVIYIDRSSLFREGGTASEVTDERIPFSWDGKHISVYGSIRAAANFKTTPQYANLAARLTR